MNTWKDQPRRPTGFDAANREYRRQRDEAPEPYWRHHDHGQDDGHDYGQDDSGQDDGPEDLV